MPRLVSFFLVLLLLGLGQCCWRTAIASEPRAEGWDFGCFVTSIFLHLGALGMLVYTLRE